MNGIESSTDNMSLIVENNEKLFNSQLLDLLKEQKHYKDALSLIATETNVRDSVDSFGLTLLHHAALLNCTVVAQHLVDQGCNIDALDNRGSTPLILAVKFEHVAMIELLLKANADVNIRDNDGRTILESVLQPGMLTRSAEVKALFLNKVRVMCADDDTLIANKLTEAGCNLIEAIRLNRPAVVKVMLEKGSSIEARDVDSNTALHVAVKLMNLEMIKILVEHGVSVDARGYQGMTPIFQFNTKFENTDAKLEILKYLLDQGATLTIPDLSGNIPLTYLLLKADKEILDIVMQYDVDLDAVNQNLLHSLVANKNPGVLEAIRGKSFDVNARNSEGLTPLLLAVRYYDLEKIEFLLEHGADVNAQSADGNTPLLYMFMERLEDQKNVSDIIELLLEHGSEIQATFEPNITIFDLAKYNGFFLRIKPVIARLAMYEVLGKPLFKYIRDQINSNLVFKYHYEKCKQHIRQLRYKIVQGSVSLFKLLLNSEDKLILYARNEEFESKFEDSISKVKNADTYILYILRKRVKKAIKIAELRRRAVIAICRITELPISICHTILYKIVDYLDNQDMETLHNL